MEYGGTAERFAKARMENFLWKNRWRENVIKNDRGKITPYPSSSAVPDMRIVHGFNISQLMRKSRMHVYTM